LVGCEVQPERNPTFAGLGVLFSQEASQFIQLIYYHVGGIGRQPWNLYNEDLVVVFEKAIHPWVRQKCRSAVIYGPGRGGRIVIDYLIKDNEECWFESQVSRSVDRIIRVISEQLGNRLRLC